MPGEVHSQHSPVNLAIKNFSALMVHVHPVHPLATPMVSSLILLPVPLGVARFVDLKRH